MTVIPLQTLEELDISADEFERLVDLGLELAIIRVMNSEDIEQALAQADQTALDLILIAWAAYVSEELLPHLDTSMVEAGAQTIARLALAVDNPLTLLTDQPLDVESYLQQAVNRLVGIGNELWFNARASLAEGIALGESQPKLAQRIRDAIGVTEPRARVIARTESHGARNFAAHMTMQRFESAYGVPPGVMRKEWQCVAGDSVLQALNVAAVARRHHEGTLVTIRTASGLSVSVTPEHRVLTGRGWVEAQALDQSDQMFRVLDADTTGTPGVQHRPPSIREVVDPLIDLPAVQVRSMFAGVDFESNGADSNVDVVWSDSSLPFGLEVGIDQSAKELFLSHADVLRHSVLFGECGRLNSSAGLRDSNPTSSTFCHAVSSRLYGFQGRSQQSRLAAVSGGNSMFSKDSHYDILCASVVGRNGTEGTPVDVVANNALLGQIKSLPRGNTENLCSPGLCQSFGTFEESLGCGRSGQNLSAGSKPSADSFSTATQICGDFDGGFSSSIALDNIIDIEVNAFSGHVYDLSTASEWFAANGLVVHNSTMDARTRHTHDVADGQTVSFTDPFIVGGFPLAFPGDPTGPPSETVNCRCGSLAVFDPEDLNLNDNGTVITLNAAAYLEEDAVPWSIETGNAECGEGQHAVVKDADGTVEGCHDTRDEALAQVAALYASEGEKAAIPASNRNTVPWSGVLVVEGTRTGDGREFAPNSLTWPAVGQTASLELPLGWMYERAHGGMSTDKVANVGRIDTITRVGNELHGTGVINLDSEWGRKAARQMGTRDDPGFLAGVSIDADDPEDPFQADVEYVFPEGCSLTEEEVTAEGDEPLAEPVQAACEVPESVRYHTGRIRAATLVDIPAFVEGRIYLDAPIPEETPEDDAGVVTASAYTITIPDLPPVEWFREPEDEPEIGAITVTEDGRFYGYLAPKQVAHRGIRNKRVTVPTGNVDYGIWMNRATIVDDGRGGFAKIATGPITMDCGHAPLGPKGSARREHYDNACSVVATACVGENSRGVWISGALIPGVNADQVARMMACQLSGDWGPHRERPGKRELAAALLVPVPGFPTAQRSFTIQGGELSRTMTPVRFGTFAGVTEPVGLRAAIDQVAAQVGRDHETRMREFVSNLRETLKGD